MSLIKKNIHMNHIRGKIISQITLDDDLNVPDRLPDIAGKITQNGTILTDSVKASQNKISLQGKLKFQMMYKAGSGDGQIHKLEGSLPFEELINMEGIEDGDTINVDLVIDDLSISVINSRKISVKAVITVTAIAENIHDEDFSTEIEDEDMEYIQDTIELTQLAIRKKDLLRIKEEINLIAGKLNINEIIWTTANLTGSNVRLMEDKLLVNGEIAVFVLYSSEEGPLQWTNASIPFNGTLEVPGCNENMIPNVELKLTGVEIEAKPDFDGEQRILLMDGIVTVNIKLYEEQQFDIVKDAYSRKKDLVLKTKDTEYENLLMKNVTKCKVTDKISTGSHNDTRILQICSCTGDVKIDDTNFTEDGIAVEGVLSLTILYICSDDLNPLCCINSNIPFSQKIDVNGIKENSVFSIRAIPEQLATNMVGTDEIEIKSTLLLDCIVFDKLNCPVVTEIEEKDYDMDMISALPGIVGYVCQNGDTLWSIAKKFYTTVDCLRQVNDVTGEVEPGQMLVVVKKVSAEALG